MRAKMLLVAWAVVQLLPSSAWAQGAPGSAAPAQHTAAQADRLEDFAQRLGPFELKDQRFEVVLHKKRVPGGTDHDTQETLTRLVIRGPGGAVHYEASFPYRLAGSQFEETMDAQVQTLEGTQGTGLLVTFGELPSPPLGGESWQLFGIVNSRLVPFTKPIQAYGQLIAESRAEGIVETSKEPNFQLDVLRFRLWSGNFFVIVPLRVDWPLARVSLAWRCFKIMPQGQRPICQYGVEASRVPSQENLTFVRLFPEAIEGFIPAHVVVRKDSKVEVLTTEAEVVWAENPDSVKITIADDPWLKVRIDGREGWIHSQEDFQAIGLPMAD